MNILVDTTKARPRPHGGFARLRVRSHDGGEGQRAWGFVREGLRETKRAREDKDLQFVTFLKKYNISFLSKLMLTSVFKKTDVNDIMLTSVSTKPLLIK